MTAGGEVPTDPSGGGRYRKLKPGPGWTPEQVAAHQRNRLHEAMIEEVAESGYAKVTVEAVAERARVSKASFYKHFSGKEECFLSTYNSVTRCIARRALAAQRAEPDGEAAARASLTTLVELVAERPQAARTVLVDALDAGPAARERIWATSRVFEALVAEAFAKPPGGVRLSPAVARGIVAGVAQVMRARFLAGREADLADEIEPLLDWALSFRGSAPSALVSGHGLFSQSRGRANENRDSAREKRTAPDDRELILAAITRAAASHGYSKLTVPKVRAAAGVSRQSFDSHFDALADCFLTAVDTQVERLLSEARADFDSAGSWQEGVCRGATTLCSYLAREPMTASVAFVAPLDLGSVALGWRGRWIVQLIGFLRAAAPPEVRPGELTVEASAAAAWSVLGHQVRAGRMQHIRVLAPTIAHLVLAPVLGDDAGTSVTSHEQNGKREPLLQV